MTNPPSIKTAFFPHHLLQHSVITPSVLCVHTNTAFFVHNERATASCVQLLQHSLLTLNVLHRCVHTITALCVPPNYYSVISSRPSHHSVICSHVKDYNVVFIPTIAVFFYTTRVPKSPHQNAYEHTTVASHTIPYSSDMISHRMYEKLVIQTCVYLFRAGRIPNFQNSCNIKNLSTRTVT